MDMHPNLCHHCRLKSIHSRSDTNRTRADGLSFYYPRLLHCLNQMLAVMLLSQHRVSSSKTVRPRAPCGARCIEHAIRTWSAICSEAPHLQFGVGARPTVGANLCEKALIVLIPFATHIYVNLLSVLHQQ